MVTNEYHGLPRSTLDSVAFLSITKDYEGLLRIIKISMNYYYYYYYYY